MTPALRQHRLLLLSLVILSVIGIDWLLSYTSPCTIIYMRGLAQSEVDRRELVDRFVALRHRRGQIAVGWAMRRRTNAFRPPMERRLICQTGREELPDELPIPLRAAGFLGFRVLHEDREERLPATGMLVCGESQRGIAVPHWFLAGLAGMYPVVRGRRYLRM